jgi:acetaldehyde/propanal dehydrogenase
MTDATTLDLQPTLTWSDDLVMNMDQMDQTHREFVNLLASTETAPDEAAIRASILDMIAEVQRYVPGYALKQGPVFEGNRVSTFLEVAGLGDYLPKYAGNLDIMTAAALRTGEMFAQRAGDGGLKLSAGEAA